MMPENHQYSSSSVAAGIHHHWNNKSPIPYLFGGLALMLGLIALALIILACSYKKRPSSSEEDDAEQKPASKLSAPEIEPRIVVIMAGDHNPTYIANPSAASNSVTRHHIEEV
ncbi:hypothetical protein M9H77_15641 [Catharanthus roseus]|uniref:Uncharacterized protein n=1 Tax=Catharanthus roseus TaxID=4058 RepID=A0ACC0AXS1_CATRO|nr:hypothetical protein M9H77_15641 [Catharanthus roseus]